MRIYVTIFVVSFFLSVKGQYYFSGYIDSGDNSTSVYLSLIEDYRQLNGIYNDQIITKTIADSTGYFEFKGDLLEDEHRIYRIHSDNCSDFQNITNNTIFCPNSYAVVFIAKNKDTISFPYGFEKQIFCDIQSNNEKAVSLMKIDSLKEEMKFAYSEFRSDANKKLNNKKWFSTLQHFSESTNEPLAELYAYAYLSDRSNETFRYYIEDLQSNTYYQDLNKRLAKLYPNTTYTNQYNRELEADRYIFSNFQSDSDNYWTIFIYSILLLSLGLNATLIYRRYQEKRSHLKHLKAQLSKQELIVLNLLLQNKTNKDIADALFVSISTVKTHTNNIYKKLNVQSREDVKSLFIN